MNHFKNTGENHKDKYKGILAQIEQYENVSVKDLSPYQLQIKSGKILIFSTMIVIPIVFRTALF